jgi:fucose permease
MCAPGADEPEHRRQYRRDGFTWAAFGMLAGFGFLNALLGPALPYLRAVEHISYVTGSLHQVAFAVGGGLAGLAAARTRNQPGRGTVIRAGLMTAALAGLGIGYGRGPAVTVTAAFVTSLLGTSALIRMWAALSDRHGDRRSVALIEGEAGVSLGGIIAPLFVAGLAASQLSWRFAFVTGAVIVAVTVAASLAARIPASAPAAAPGTGNTPGRRDRPAATLIMVLAVVALEFSLSFWLASYLNDVVGLPRGLAAAMVAGLYAANLAGRLAASRLARVSTPQRVLALSLGVALAGTPVLLTATGALPAAVGIAVTGAGTGATFPLASSLHIAASSRPADGALGQILTAGAAGQILGPLGVAGIAQAAGLRAGLLIVPGAGVLAAAALLAQHRRRPGLRGDGLVRQ